MRTFCLNSVTICILVSYNFQRFLTISSSWIQAHPEAPKNQEVTRVASFCFCPFEANLRQQMWHFPLNSICFHHFSLIIFGLKTIFSQVFIFLLQPPDCWVVAKLRQTDEAVALSTYIIICSSVVSVRFGILWEKTYL